MNTSQQVAKHFKEVIFGGNWTAVNLKDSVSDLNWQQATQKVGNLNTIATLVHHTQYYVSAVLKVLEGGTLQAKDELSFDHSPIQSEEDWQNILTECWSNAEKFAQQIEQLPDHLWEEDFVAEKYGIYYRNLHGIIEHTHYHLGQINLIKKLL